MKKKIFFKKNANFRRKFGENSDHNLGPCVDVNAVIAGLFSGIKKLVGNTAPADREAGFQSTLQKQ
jgi:hypothetical protein